MQQERAAPKSAKERVKELGEAATPAIRLLATDIEILVKTTNALVKSGNAAKLAAHYVRVKQYRDAAESVLSALSLERDRLAYELVPKVFDSEEATTITLEMGYRVTLSSFLRATINQDKRDLAHKWLRKHGHGDAIIETVNSSTLSSLAKELMAENRELPEDIFSVHVGRNTSVTKVQR